MIPVHFHPDTLTPAANEVLPFRRFATHSVRSSEWLLLAYFLYAALFSIWNSNSVSDWPFRNAAIAVGICVVLALAWLDARTGSLLVSCVRDWIPTALILVAYWSVDWFQGSGNPAHFDNTWIGFDRMLLQTWGGKAAVESLGPAVPFLLEMSYCVLYAVAPVSVGIIYYHRRRERVDRLLTVLLMGTLTTYVLLPHFPSLSPRVAFSGQDLPTYNTPFRMLNLWLLNHFDIRASVCPSGHVTLGFSAAFAMLVAMPERRYLGVGLLLLAIAVLLATIYGRYHYAVDGLAGLAVSLTALLVTILFRRGS